MLNMYIACYIILVYNYCEVIIMPITEAQKRASINYQKKLSSISIRLKPEHLDKIKQRANQKGLSLRAYLLGLIEADISSDLSPDE